MANVKKGQLTSAPEWWKHLRKTKRVFWKAERAAGKHEAKDWVATGDSLTTSARDSGANGKK